MIKKIINTPKNKKSCIKNDICSPILIADDEKDILDMYVKALSDHGYKVFSANNGKEAMKILKEATEKINYLLLDIVMPSMDGFDVLKKIKGDKKYKNTCVIMFSNLDSNEDWEEAVRLGANGYLVKSEYTPSKLIKMIEENCNPKSKDSKFVNLKLKKTVKL